MKQKYIDWLDFDIQLIVGLVCLDVNDRVNELSQEFIFRYSCCEFRGTYLSNLFCLVSVRYCPLGYNFHFAQCRRVYILFRKETSIRCYTCC
jgi:hypothetical protein